MWVTHQNLARAKGGRPHYQFKERKVLTVQKAPPASSAPVQPREAASESVEPSSPRPLDEN